MQAAERTSVNRMRCEGEETHVTRGATGTFLAKDMAAVENNAGAFTHLEQRSLGSQGFTDL